MIISLTFSKDWDYHPPGWMNRLKFPRRGWARVFLLFALHFWLWVKVVVKVVNLYLILEEWKSAWLETEGPRVRASPASLRCGPWARHIYPSLVLVQPRKTRPCLTERLLMGRKESNQTKQNKQEIPRYIESSLFLIIGHHSRHQSCRNFDIPKMSVRIDCTAPKLMPTR